MNKNVILNDDEIIVCVSALKTFMENDNANLAGLYFKKDIKLKVGGSALKKLENYHPLTYFTKQEYTMIYTALNYIISIGANSDELFSAERKISALAE